MTDNTDTDTDTDTRTDTHTGTDTGTPIDTDTHTHTDTRTDTDTGTGTDTDIDGETTEGSASEIGRRTYVRSVGAALVALGTTASSRPPTLVSEFDTVIDVVDAGADPEGTEPIDAVVERHAGDDTLLMFPAGRYAIGSVVLDGFSHLGLAAAEKTNTTLVPVVRRDRVDEVFLLLQNGRNLLLDGFDFDMRRPGYGITVGVHSTGDLLMRNLRKRGAHPDRTIGFRFQIENPRGRGLVENLVATDGAESGADAIGMFTNKVHSGTITVRNCRLEGFSNNGIYASAPGLPDGGNGPIHVEGGVYENNNIANVRLGSTGSSARRVSVVVDDPPALRGVTNARGIRLRDRTELLVADCEVILDAGRSDGGIVVEAAAGRATIRNTAVEVNADGESAIYAKPPSDDRTPSNDRRLALRGVVVTGSAAGGDAVSIAERPGSTVRECCIDQSGRNRDGIVLTDAPNCVVADSTIDVTGGEIVSDTPVVTRCIDRSGPCRDPRNDAAR